MAAEHSALPEKPMPYSEVAFVERAYAAYGGVYIAVLLLWLWAVERVIPDFWDTVGAGLCLAGAALLLWGPRPL